MDPDLKWSPGQLLHEAHVSCAGPADSPRMGVVFSGGPVSDHGASCSMIESITLDRSTANWYAGHSMTPEFWAIIGVGVIVLGSHLSLHRDIATIRERMAKLEGAVDGFMHGQSSA